MKAHLTRTNYVTGLKLFGRSSKIDKNLTRQGFSGNEPGREIKPFSLLERQDAGQTIVNKREGDLNLKWLAGKAPDVKNVISLAGRRV